MLFERPVKLRETAIEQVSLQITSGRHLWPGHPPFIREVLVEENACNTYVNYMHKHGHPVKTTPSGFVVHPDKGWLGASLDAWVTDHSSAQVEGLQSLSGHTLSSFLPLRRHVKTLNFYCTMVNGQIQLRIDHQYYHQVQLQLYVASDLCQWCDFCI